MADNETIPVQNLDVGKCDKDVNKEIDHCTAAPHFLCLSRKCVNLFFGSVR